MSRAKQAPKYPFSDPIGELTWMQDSGGVTSVHRNGPGLSMKESYLGRILQTPKDGGGFDWWAECESGDEKIGVVKQGPYANLGDARAMLTKMAMLRLRG